MTPVATFPPCQRGSSVGAVSFEVSADSYGQLMARYSEPLARDFAAFAGVRAGHRVLDVGCGPGALTAELVRRLGPDQVWAIDPSVSFAEAARDRLPEADVRVGAAENLPFADSTFDVTLAQLVVQFMADPVADAGEMARVTRRGGVIAACVWDRGGDRSPLSPFWRAVRELDPAAESESDGRGTRAGDLAAVFTEAGLHRVEASQLTVRAPQVSFEQWWEPFQLGVGPGGDYVRSLGDGSRDQLRERCRRLHAAEPAQASATAWAVRGKV